MRRAWLLGAYVVLCVSACEANLDTSLEHKECSDQGQCLPGYRCSDDRMCVPLDAGVRSDPGSMAPAAAGREPDPSVNTSCAPASLCDGACVNISTDVEHCGGCGRRCPQAEHGQSTCNAGVCQPACADGYMSCGDRCYQLQSDPLHCGGCAVSCPDVEGGVAVCEAGKCGARCPGESTVCAGGCVNTVNDPMNCGKCGNVCQADQDCAGGNCVDICPAGTLTCAHSCVDVQSETKHCGGCDKPCSAPAGAVAACQAGSCSWSCGGTLSQCGEACVDRQSDPANCGTCGRACPAPPENATRVCERGGCLMRCNAGFTDCEGQCINGNVVETARGLGLGTLGVCAAAIAVLNRTKCGGMGQNATFCGGECVNTNSNVKHCGGCGNACRQYCFRAMCF